MECFPEKMESNSLFGSSIRPIKNFAVDFKIRAAVNSPLGGYMASIVLMNRCNASVVVEERTRSA